MLRLLRRLGVGMVYGVGFAIGVAGVAALTAMGGATWFAARSGEGITLQSPRPSAPQDTSTQFVFSDTSEVKNEWGGLNIVGTVVNKRANTSRFVNVYADLFDKNGKFIFQCSTQFQGGLPTGQRVNFMIQCYGLPKDLLAKYASYKVHARAFDG